jgi:hypothetical protein
LLDALDSSGKTGGDSLCFARRVAAMHDPTRNLRVLCTKTSWQRLSTAITQWLMRNRISEQCIRLSVIASIAGIDAELTDEHIIPFGLGGREILPKASCKTCAKETGRVEHRILRGMFWPIRLRQKVQSRRPAPDTLKASIVHSTGTKKVIDVAPNDYPDHLIMLNMKQPGI